MEKLLDYGADRNFVDRYGRKPIDWAPAKKEMRRFSSTAESQVYFRQVRNSAGSKQESRLRMNWNVDKRWNLLQIPSMMSSIFLRNDSASMVVGRSLPKN